MADEFDIEALRGAASEGKIHWHKHALERILERGVPLEGIVTAIMRGELIEVYSEDRPFPSALIGFVGIEPVHVVVAVDSEAEVCHVITAYRPDREHFETDSRTRRKDR